MAVAGKLLFSSLPPTSSFSGKVIIDRWLIWRFVFFATCLSFALGCSLACLNTTASTLAVFMQWCGNEHQYECDEANHKGALLTHVARIGAVVGCMLDIPLVKRGRIFTMKVTSVLYIVSSLLVVFGTNFTTMIIGRLICGLAVGATTVGVPMYVAEISPTAERGYNVSLCQLMLSIGMFVAVAAGLFLDTPDGSYKYHIPQTTVFVLKCILGLPIIPSICTLAYFTNNSLESPTWLLKRKGPEEALEVLNKIYTADDANKELDELLSINAGDSPNETVRSVSVLRAFMMRQHRRLVLLGCFIGIFAQLCGFSVFLASCAGVLDSDGVSPHKVVLLSSGLALFHIFVVMQSAVLVDAYGRKLMLQISYLGQALALTSYLLVFLCRDDKDMGWVSFCAIIGCVTFYAFGAGPVTFLYLNEMFPPEVKESAVGLCLSLYWAASFLIGFLVSYVPVGVAYSVFWLSTAMAFFVVTLWCEETSGKPLGFTARSHKM
eukprot:Selendium_serpulae@DN11118_c0_g1_i1.p1